MFIPGLVSFFRNRKHDSAELLSKFIESMFNDDQNTVYNRMDLHKALDILRGE